MAASDSGVHVPVHDPIDDMATSVFGYMCVTLPSCVFAREGARHFPVLFAWQSGDAVCKITMSSLCVCLSLV